MRPSRSLACGCGLLALAALTAVAGTISGGPPKQYLKGSSGDDTIHGGGTDTLTCGAASSDRVRADAVAKVSEDCEVVNG